MKRLISLMLSAFLVLGLAACTPATTTTQGTTQSTTEGTKDGDTTTTTPPAETPSESPSEEPSESPSEEPSESPSDSEAPPSGDLVEISMTVLDRGAIPAEIGTYSENPAVDYINEEMNKLGVKVTVVPVPRNESYAKMNTMLAAKTAPNILYEYSRNYADQLRSQKAIMPLDDVIEKYSTDYKEYLNNYSDLLRPYLTFEDGKLWAFSSLRSQLHTVGVWARKDLLDDVGLGIPTTLEEVIDASKAVVEKNAEITPVVATWHYLNIIKGTYGYSSDEIKDGDDIIHPIFSEQYKKAMEMARRFYQEKIVDQEYITDAQFARQYQLWTSGKALFIFDTLGQPKGTDELVKANHDVEVVPLAPFKSEYGQFMLTPQNAARFINMVNADVADNEEVQQAIWKYVDWLITGGWEIIAQGREGVQYNLSDDGFRVGIPNAPSWPFGEFPLVTQETYTYGENAARQPDENLKYLSRLHDFGIRQMLSFPVAMVTPYQFSNDDFAEFNTVFSPKLSEIETKMQTDENYTIEQGIEEAQQAFRDMDGEHVWELKSAWYKENRELMETFIKGYNAFKDELYSKSILPDDMSELPTAYGSK